MPTSLLLLILLLLLLLSAPRPAAGPARQRSGVGSKPGQERVPSRRAAGYKEEQRPRGSGAAVRSLGRERAANGATGGGICGRLRACARVRMRSKKKRVEEQEYEDFRVKDKFTEI